MNRIEGAIEQLDAAAEQRTFDNIGDIARELRDAVTEMIGDVTAELDRLDADAGARFRDQFGTFAPRMVGENPYRPNPITQPGNPNPTPESEARDRTAFEEEQAKDSGKKAASKK